MTSGVISDATAVVAQLGVAVAELGSMPLSGLGEQDLLAVMREVETLRRQLAAVDARLIAEAGHRGLPGRFSARSLPVFVAGLWNLSPREAARRVRHADHLGPRVTATGEQLAPLLPAAAQARAAGLITGEHVEVIIRTIGKLPTTLPVEDITAAEQFLVEQAEVFDATTLAKIARQLIDTLDPDGTLTDEQSQHAHRRLTLTPTSNGMHRLLADLDGETAAIAMTVLHSLAAPQPEPDSTERDDRTPGQRMHDALSSVLKLALRSGQLPATGGVPATVLITMTAEQFQTGTGLASTSFGQRLTVPQALRLADEASISWIVHNSVGAVLNHGRTHRLASRTQTLALIARDKGCSFPGCTAPPEWTERHHVIAWRHGGPTDLTNLTLLCAWHHHRIDTGGWTITMTDGIPWYTPPDWIDPHQRPRRNTRP